MRIRHGVFTEELGNLNIRYSVGYVVNFSRGTTNIQLYIQQADRF